MSEEDNFVDQDNYQEVFGTNTKEKDITFKGIVLSHILRLASLSSTDFDEGGYIKKTSFFDSQNRLITTESYIPSKRKSFINSVRFFHDLVFPELIKKTNSQNQEKWNIAIETMKNAAMKCLEIELEISNIIPTPQQINMLTEAYRSLFLATNTACSIANYFGKMSVQQ